MSGPCLSSSVAGRPLRPATRHSLGEPLPHQQADRPRAHQEASCDFGFGRMSSLATCGINSPFGELSPTSRQIAHVLRTRLPLDQVCIATNVIPFDLHVLSTPPAFVLSQNQTLREKFAPCVEQGKVSDYPFVAGRTRHRYGPSNFKKSKPTETHNSAYADCLFVCVLNFAGDRRKFESDFQKACPVGGAPSSGFFPAVSAGQGHPRKIVCLPATSLAGGKT